MYASSSTPLSISSPTGNFFKSEESSTCPGDAKIGPASVYASGSSFVDSEAEGIQLALEACAEARRDVEKDIGNQIWDAVLLCTSYRDCQATVSRDKNYGICSIKICSATTATNDGRDECYFRYNETGERQAPGYYTCTNGYSPSPKEIEAMTDWNCVATDGNDGGFVGCDARPNSENVISVSEPVNSNYE